MQHSENLAASIVCICPSLFNSVSNYSLPGWLPMAGISQLLMFDARVAKAAGAVNQHGRLRGPLMKTTTCPQWESSTSTTSIWGTSSRFPSMLFQPSSSDCRAACLGRCPAVNLWRVCQPAMRGTGCVNRTCPGLCGTGLGNDPVYPAPIAPSDWSCRRYEPNLPSEASHYRIPRGLPAWAAGSMGTIWWPWLFLKRCR